MRKIRIALAIVPILVLGIFFIKCGNSPSQHDSMSTSDPLTPTTVNLQGTNDKETPIIVLEDGSKLIGQQQITEHFKTLIQNNPDATFNLNISGEEVPVVTQNGEDMIASPYYHSLPFNYGVVFGFHYDWVRNCNPLRQINHFNFLINRPGIKDPIVDIHAGGWYENKKLCFCIYITPQKKVVFNRCTPTYGQITGGIAAALVAAGVSYSVAWAIANVIGPIVAAGFVI